MGYLRSCTIGAGLLLLAPLLLDAADYDLVIRNARIVDGTGKPAFIADVAIANRKIAAIGKLPGAKAPREIDAREHVLAPGFIDVHTHVDAHTPIEKLPAAANYIRDGVTTVVAGNCGGSPTDLAKYFALLEKVHTGPNVASLIGHNSVRRAVMGDVNRPATPDEIKRMQAIVAQAMQDGAVGFSTGLIYIPGTYSSTAEVIALAREAARFHGVYASHMRNEGARVIAAIHEAVQVGREAHLPVEISHFKIDNLLLWGDSEKTIALVEQYRREGVDVSVDQYPYDRSSTTLATLAPSWALADGAQAIRERLSTPATRARIAAEMRRSNAALGHRDYAFTMVASCRRDHSIDGKTIPEINLAQGGRPGIDGEIQVILDLLARDPTGTSVIKHTMGMVDVERIMRYPLTAIASDGEAIEEGVGSPHPRAYGTNACVLAEFVRVRHVLTLEDAIRRMTQLPAEKFGFHDRGEIREGAAADLVLFDPENIQDHATYAQPHQYSTGFDYVIVNGEIEVEADKLTGARAGQVLRHQP